MPAETTIEELKTYHRDRINDYCELPKIGEYDAFALWYAATNLVASLVTLRKFTTKFGVTQIATLARTYAHRMRLHPAVPKLAANIVRLIAASVKNDGVKKGKAK